ncbi:DUF4239 domain-containing protein [Bradyrhizobium sp. dw_411]|uniref:bestrophin-like domain n=1 Tax=Bradyrhizobium sp. dw_411 TaxID=2720082 RepID=UPI001BCF5566|nr:DUF4239 domain-containing protein [Bradyrhizobium sp. dw_411]
MNDLLISLLVFAVIFGGALAGMAIRPLLAESHLQPDSKDVVKMATGLIGTLAALVLGLLIASAKSSFDQKTTQVRQLTASVILLDNLLAQYGPDAKPVRIRLRQAVQPAADRIWNEQKASLGRPVPFESSAQSSTFETELERLSPGNDTQRALQSRAVATFAEGAQTRLLLFAQAGGSIPAPFLIILVFWLSAIFVSFTLFAKANPVVMASLLVCAVSFAGAIFLVLELDNPFTGLMGISSATLRDALAPLNP